jgi:hypothetical protein
MLAMRAAPEWPRDQRPGEYDPFSKEVMDGTFNVKPPRVYADGWSRLQPDYE